MGTPGRTWKLSEETKERMRQAARRRPPMTDAHRKAMSEAKKGKPQDPEINEKRRQTMLSKGKDHHNYKEDASYSAVHYWIARRYGKAKQCINCQVEDKSRYFWANVSGEYKRDISDWLELCASCHSKFDLHLITVNGIERGSIKLAEGKYRHKYGK